MSKIIKAHIILELTFNLESRGMIPGQFQGSGSSALERDPEYGMCNTVEEIKTDIEEGLLNEEWGELIEISDRADLTSYRVWITEK